MMTFKMWWNRLTELILKIALTKRFLKEFFTSSEREIAGKEPDMGIWAIEQELQL